MGCTSSVSKTKVFPVIQNTVNPSANTYASNGHVKDGNGTIQKGNTHHELKLKNNFRTCEDQSNGISKKSHDEMHGVEKKDCSSDDMEQEQDQELEDEMAMIINMQTKTKDNSTKLFAEASHPVNLPTEHREYHKSLVYDVNLDGKIEKDKLFNLKKRPPKFLESLSVDAPRLTSEELNQKLKAAEEKRHKELTKKKKQAKQMSRRKRDVLEAREIDQAESKSQEINTKMNFTSQNRAKKQKDIIEKQKKREERARQVRERARKIKEGEAIDERQDSGIETYHAESDDDSWTDDLGNLNDKHEKQSEAGQELDRDVASPAADGRPGSVDNFFNSNT